MRDILKKIIVGVAVVKGLDYAKYRLNGGTPLLDRVRNTVLFIKGLCKEDKPITLEANDYKIV